MIVSSFIERTKKTAKREETEGKREKAEEEEGRTYPEEQYEDRLQDKAQKVIDTQAGNQIQVNVGGYSRTFFI